MEEIIAIRQTKEMKTPLTFLLSLTFLFLVGCSGSGDEPSIKTQELKENRSTVKEHLNKSNVIDEKRLSQCEKGFYYNEDVTSFLQVLKDRDIDDVYKYITEKGVNLHIVVVGGFINITTRYDFDRHFDIIFNQEFIDTLRNYNSCLDRNWGGYLNWPLTWSHEETKVSISFGSNGGYDYRPSTITNETISIEDFILPSFNCGEVKSKSEKTICSDHELSWLDAELSDTYQEAKEDLSGQDYVDLIPNQRKFLKERDRCGNDKTCLSNIIETRTLKIDKLIEGEPSKPSFKIHGGTSKMINGEWRSGTISSTSNCGTNDFDEMGPYSVLIDLPKIVITEHGTDMRSPLKWECRVKKTFDTSIDEEHQNSRLTPQMRWGTCGGSWDRLNYFGSIIVMELEHSSKDRKFIGDSFLDLGCQNIVVSSNGGKTSLVLGHYNSLSDQLLSRQGFKLKRQ